MYNKEHHIHFVGIGGIGMSGIAKILKLQGYTISGCDTNLSQKSILDLQALGCTIYQGNNTPQCHDHSIDVLVYSSDIRPNAEELVYARSRSIPTIQRALMLAEIMRIKFSIAVTGAHGKTTVTSLISHILIDAKLDPTVIIGGHLKAISSNAHHGSGDFLIAEADESDRSFLRLYPTIAVVTNIDREHLDTYKDLDDIKKSFAEFITHVPFYGKAIICLDDPHLRTLLPLHQTKTITYALDHLEGADYYGTDIILDTHQSSCNVYNKGHLLGRITVSMAGKHNLLNALGALATALDVGVSFEQAAQALASFKGVDRRFTYKGTFQGAEVIDDYGHHPTEIHNTLLVARKRAQGKLIVVFQPHRYSRTELLWDDFVSLLAYSPIDELIITDIHGASEDPRPGINAQALMAAIEAKHPASKITYAPTSETFEEIQALLRQKATPNDLILIQGAGKITKLGDLLTK